MATINPAPISDASNRSAQPQHIYRPVNSSDVQDVIKKTVCKGTLLTVVGGRSSVTGSCVPSYGGDALDMSLLRSVEPRADYKTIQVDGKNPFTYLLHTDGQTGIFPPGITLAEMDDALARQGLFFASKPGYMGGQLGGAASTNASGPRTLSLGDTRRNVVSLKVILPNGEAVVLERNNTTTDNEFTLPGVEKSLLFPSYVIPTSKNSVGFYSSPEMSPLDLFVGSEGTLGVFVEIETRLIKRRPLTTQLIFFESIESAFLFAGNLRQAVYGTTSKDEGVLSIEFMDQNALSIVSDLLSAHGIQTKATGVAIEVEYFADDMSTRKLVAEASREHHAMSKILEGQLVMELRYTVPQRVNAVMKKRGFVKIASDFAVPAENFQEMYRAYQEADQIMRKATGQKVSSATWGHLGNYHLHWNGLPTSESSRQTALEIYQGLATKALALGGTLSAEHGTGKKEIFPGQPMLLSMSQEMYDYARNLIEQINPGFLLNRGNMLGFPPKQSI